MTALTIRLTTPCPVCACRVHGFMFGSGRINKRSVRVQPGSLIVQPDRCPECGGRVACDPPWWRQYLERGAS